MTEATATPDAGMMHLLHTLQVAGFSKDITRGYVDSPKTVTGS